MRQACPWRVCINFISIKVWHFGILLFYLLSDFGPERFSLNLKAKIDKVDISSIAHNFVACDVGGISNLFLLDPVLCVLSPCTHHAHILLFTWVCGF